MKNFKSISRGFFIHATLIIVSLLSIFPFLWLLSTALKGNSENIFQYPPVFFPQEPTLANFKGVWNQIPFMLYFLNSMVVAGFTVLLNLILSALAAYPLARMEFRGKKTIFYATLATIMIPFQAIMLPVYLIVLKLHMVDSVNSVMGYLGLILPFAVNAFGIFLMRQAFLAIPKEMEEAAFVDGCSVFQIWWKILLPMVKPTLAVLAIFTFIGSWGEFLWPSIVLTKKALYTLPVGVNDLQGMFSANWRFIAAGSIIATIPILVFFIAMQRYFISGENDGAVKG
ncbi:MAG TPA: carbohydrate ABC transporter permease [Candidatus Limenecus avicola]|uniref:Carbohydrate ABC transporter permease n=1 Tax=Candidatus Limenecus avicola TaxID=2840847 RepID=A0A9D1N033_9CLOT|nr:permease protein of sugar ABC transporter [Clostridium sp. CAG:306]HIU92344.1 carbohydrate ABC transporter permease [Candidatus Limenecus avicola]